MFKLFKIGIKDSACKQLLILVSGGKLQIMPTYRPKLAGSKDPGPENPALSSPQRGEVYRRLRMEWWNNGILGIESGWRSDFIN